MFFTRIMLFSESILLVWFFLAIFSESNQGKVDFVNDMRVTYHNSYKYEARKHIVLIADESTYSYNDSSGEQIVYTPHRKVALQIYDHLGSIGVKFSTGLCNGNDSDVVIRWTGMRILPTIY